MSNHFSNAPTQRQASLTAGLAYLVIILLAFFANFFVLERLTDPDDVAATAGNIANHPMLFRGAVAAFVVVFILDVVAAWGLYFLLRRTSRELSLLTAWFRIMSAVISAAALLNVLIAVKLMDDTGYTTAIASGQRNAHVMLFLDAYTYGWSIGLVCFGVHLLLAGLLLVKSDHAPRTLGVLVAAAGLAYLVLKLVSLVLPNYNDALLALIVVLAVPGEFGLTAWLLWRGGKGRSATDQQGEMASAGSAA